MIKEILLPDLGEGIETVDVSEVLVSPGDNITPGDIILVLESEKASMEIPSEEKGKIQKVFVTAGDQIKAGEILIIMDVVGETVNKKETKKQKIEPEPEPEPESEKETTIPQLVKTEKIKTQIKQSFASPGTRKLARELEIDLAIINGTGLKGRVTKNDLHAYIKTQMHRDPIKEQLPPTPKIDFSQWGEIKKQPLTKIKHIAGERLQLAWQTIPHVTQFNKADISKMDANRKVLRSETKNTDIKITFLPFIIQAAAATLKEFPEFNSSLDHTGENLVIKNYYHFGIAVDTPSGLTAPVITNVDKKSLLELSIELMDISSRAREKKLEPQELKGSSFTISSLGGIGGTYFTPIINPPDVAILGISRSEWVPMYEPNNKEIIPKYMMPFSLSYDHRVIDGAAAAAFTNRFAEIVLDESIFKR